MKRRIKILFYVLGGFSLMGLGQLLFGQIVVDWNNAIEIANDGEGFGVEQTNDDGYIAIGSQYLSDSHLVWLLKFDIDGSIVWSTTYGRGGNDGGRAVRQTTDDGYILVGSDDDIWLIKTDSQGDTLWTRTYKGGASDIEQTPDGGYIIIGNRLLKLDAAGDSVWSNTTISGGDIEQTSDRGFIITGGIWTDDNNQEDVWLIRTGSHGDTLWTRTFGGSGDDWGNQVFQTKDGGYIVAAGYDWNHWDFSDGYCIKIDSIGNTLWTFTDSTFSSEGISELDDGSFLILGDSHESNYYHTCLTKLDKNGNKLWTKTSEQDSFGWHRDCQFTNDGGYVLIGGIDTKSDDDNLWICKLREASLSIKEQIENPRIRLSPIPIGACLTININKSDIYDIDFYALNGQLQLTERMYGSSYHIDLSSFQPGVYFITIRSKDFVTTRKIIKM